MGEHVENLKCLACQQTLVKKYIMQLKHGIGIAEQLKRRSVATVALCGWGRHRSPAVVRLLKEIAERNGYVCDEPVHLSRHAWHEYLCYWCPECQPGHPAKDELFDEMAKLWDG